MKATNPSRALISFLFCVSAMGAQQPSSPKTQTDQAAQPSAADAQQTGPTLLTYKEIIQLYQQENPTTTLRDKLNRLLTTPFVKHQTATSGVRPSSRIASRRTLDAHSKN
jgi:hypothetical protein